MPDPIIVEIGFLKIRWYGVLIAAAILLGTFLALKEIRKKNIDEDKFMNVLLLGIPAAFVCARLYYVLLNWEYYGSNLGEIPAVWNGGLAIHGGIIGAFLTAGIMLKYYKINFWQVADAVSPSLVLGQAIGRWGNYFNQEAYGYEVNPETIPWAMWIDGAFRHPTFLYESFWNLLIFSLLLFVRGKFNPKEGTLLSLYLGGYSLGRFFIEGFRTDSLMLGSLRIAQVSSLVFIVLSIILFFYISMKKNN
jgi:phosphatidylglycerol:prolipoprotein diacylglycerol transferase